MKKASHDPTLQHFHIILEMVIFYIVSLMFRNSYVEILMPSARVVGSGVLGRGLGHEVEAS